MIDHVSLNVADLEKSRDFYKAVLASIGYKVILDIEDVAKFGAKGCSLGEDGHTRLWLSGGEEVVKTHIAFTASSEGEVQVFYQAGLEAGGTDNGAPGIREHYAPNYYAAFIHDLDGNNIEMVYHA